MERDPAVRDLVGSKLEKFVSRGYIQPGSVKSLISFFTVPKGDADVRVVFDGTRPGLNDTIWAPSFHLPTIKSLLPMVEPGSWQSDIDVGEQFYNYCLDPNLRAYCGLDVTEYVPLHSGKTRWLEWSHCVMGIKSSPHGCVKMQTLGEEVIRGNPRQHSKPFFYDSIILNLPGSPTYDPCLAKVCKVTSYHGCTAGDMVTYVDDIRTVGHSFCHCWNVSHRVGTRLCYLGIQDALRK